MPRKPIGSMTCADLRAELERLGLTKSGKKAELVSRLENWLGEGKEANNERVNDDESSALETEVSAFEEPEEKWADSNARKLLVQDVIDGIVPMEPDNSMPLQTIFTSRPEYAPYGYGNFSSILSTIRKQVKRDMGRAKEDLAAFEAFEKLNIAHTHTARGYPEWEGSDAQKQLKDDVDEGMHEKLQTKELWLLREVYNEFPLKVFSDHIYQEVRMRKLVLPCTESSWQKEHETRKEEEIETLKLKAIVVRLGSQRQLLQWVLQ